MVPLSRVFWARRFSHRNSLASPFLVQCSLPWMWMFSTCVVTRLLLLDADQLRRGPAKHTALRGVDPDGDLVADREDLARMGLYPKRRTGVEAGIILADVAEEGALGDGGGRAIPDGVEMDVFGPDRDLDTVTGLDAVGQGSLERQSTAHFERAWGDNPGRQEIDQPHEVGDHAVGRPGIDILRRAVLLQPAAVDHRDLVGQRQRLGLVVGDVDEGDAGAALQALELDAHLLAELGI